MIIFQSHSGLILSIPTGIYEFWKTVLSIPFWTDFILAGLRIQCYDNFNFQSHSGLILSPCGTRPD